MAFKLMRSAGLVAEPAVVHMFASGVVHTNGVVELTRNAGTTAQGYVSPGQAGAVGTGLSVTAIFGVSQDYAQGNSDTLVRVIPIVPGQIWEVDVVATVATTQIGKRHNLYSDTIINNSNYDVTGATGVFHCWAISNVASGSAKLLGEFIRSPLLPQTGTVWG